MRKERRGQKRRWSGEKKRIEKRENKKEKHDQTG